MKTYKWTEEQKKALRGSIRKWTMILNETGTDEGAANCPCCYRWNYPGNSCKGCPIKEFTGAVGCEDTPYDLVRNEHPTYEQSVIELNFLRAVYLAGGGK